MCWPDCLIGPCVDHEILWPSVGQNVRPCAGHEMLGPCVLGLCVDHEMLGPCVGQTVRAVCWAECRAVC